MYLLDTNVCIFLINKRPVNVLDRLQEALNQGITISSITVAELQFGVYNSQYKEKKQDCINGISCTVWHYRLWWLWRRNIRQNSGISQNTWNYNRAVWHADRRSSNYKRPCFGYKQYWWIHTNPWLEAWRLEIKKIRNAIADFWQISATVLRIFIFFFQQFW